MSEAMDKSKDNSSGIRRFWAHLRENWGLKVAALLVACALWIYAAATAERIRTYNVPVVLTNVPPGTIVTAGNERSVPVKVRGRGIDLISTDDEEFSAVVDLQGHQPGSLVHRLTSADIEPPPGYDFTVLEISGEDELRITLDAEKTSMIRVRPRVYGQPPEGLVLLSASSQPDWVRLRGPAAALDSMDYVETAPVDLSGLTESGGVQVGLMPTSPSVELVDSNVVVVNLELSSAETRSYTLPVELEDPPEGLRVSIEPRSVELLIQGPAARLEELIEPELVVHAPLPLPGVYEVPVLPRLPDGVLVKSVSPPRVTLTIEKSPGG